MKPETKKKLNTQGHITIAEIARPGNVTYSEFYIILLLQGSQL